MDDETEELLDDIGEDETFTVLPQAVASDDPTDGCKHYKRHCQKRVRCPARVWHDVIKLQAPCCGEFFPCRVCHNEHTKGTCQLELDRAAVREVKCNKCGAEQPVQALKQ